MTQLMSAGLPDASRIRERLGETLRIDNMMAHAAESLNEAVVTCVLLENGWSRIDSQVPIVR
jgi:hypothetical protein